VSATRRSSTEGTSIVKLPLFLITLPRTSKSQEIFNRCMWCGSGHLHKECPEKAMQLWYRQPATASWEMSCTADYDRDKWLPTWAPVEAWHQEWLADWPSVVMWLWLVFDSEIVSGSAGRQSEKGGPGPWLGGLGQSGAVSSRRLVSAVPKLQGHQE
jgi:hypothetical protein